MARYTQQTPHHKTPQLDVEGLDGLHEMPALLQDAVFLHNAGLHPFPGPRGRKTFGDDVRGIPGFQWRAHCDYRLDGLHILEAFSAGPANILLAVSRGLMVLDCESTAVAQRHMRNLQERGIPRFGWWTPRGGAHFLLRIKGAGKVKPAPASTFEGSGYEIRGYGNYVLAMGSMVYGDDGQERYYVPFLEMPAAPPEVDAAQLDFLRRADGSPYKLEYARARRTGLAEQFAESGHETPKGQRNDTTLDAARFAHWYSPESLPGIRERAIQGGQRARQVDATIASAERYTKDNPPRNAAKAERQPLAWRDARVERLRAFAAVHPWRGRAGQCDKRVFLAMVEIFAAAPVANTAAEGIRASTRRIAEVIAGDRRGVMSALKRLTGDAYGQPLLTVEKRARAPYEAPCYKFAAHVWRFGSDKNAPIHSHCLVPSGQLVHICHKSHVPLHERAALGPSGVAVYDALLSAGDALTVEQLATMTGLQPRTVRRALCDDATKADDAAPRRAMTLQQAGLVEVIAGRPLRFRGVSLDAAQLDAIVPDAARDAQRRRRNRHTFERSLFLLRRLEFWRLRWDELCTFFGNLDVLKRRREAPRAVPVERLQPAAVPVEAAVLSVETSPLFAAQHIQHGSPAHAPRRDTSQAVSGRAAVVDAAAQLDDLRAVAAQLARDAWPIRDFVLVALNDRFELDAELAKIREAERAGQLEYLIAKYRHWMTAHGGRR